MLLSYAQNYYCLLKTSSQKQTEEVRGCQHLLKVRVTQAEASCISLLFSQGRCGQWKAEAFFCFPLGTGGDRFMRGCILQSKTVSEWISHHLSPVQSWPGPGHHSKVLHWSVFFLLALRQWPEHQGQQCPAGSRRRQQAAAALTSHMHRPPRPPTRTGDTARPELPHLASEQIRKLLPSLFSVQAEGWAQQSLSAASAFVSWAAWLLRRAPSWGRVWPFAPSPPGGHLWSAPSRERACSAILFLFAPRGRFRNFITSVYCSLFFFIYYYYYHYHLFIFFLGLWLLNF